MDEVAGHAPAQKRTFPSIDKGQVVHEVSYIGARMREPSTYNALAILSGVIGGIVGFSIDPTVGKAIAGVGMSVGALIGAALPEGGAKGAAVE
jgi:hypothetical protein